MNRVINFDVRESRGIVSNCWKLVDVVVALAEDHSQRRAWRIGGDIGSCVKRRRRCALAAAMYFVYLRRATVELSLELTFRVDVCAWSYSFSAYKLT